MKTLLRLAYFIFLYGLLTLTCPAATGAPYFHIAGSHGETSDELFPLKSTAKSPPPSETANAHRPRTHRQRTGRHFVD